MDIHDMGASLLLANGEQIVRYVSKQHVTGLSLIGNQVIKISCARLKDHVYLRFSEMTYPVASTPAEMLDILNSFLTGCLCGGDNGGITD